MARAAERLKPRTMAWWTPPVCGLLYGIMLVLASAPLGVWQLAFVQILPLIWVATTTHRRTLLVALAVSLGTLPAWLWVHLFILGITPFGFPLLGLYLSVFPGLFVLAMHAVWRSKLRLPLALTAALVWTAFETLRADLLLTGYPWYLLGHPLIDSAVLAGAAGLGGVALVTFLVASASGAMADAAGRGPIRRTLGGVWIAVVGVCWLSASWAGSAGAPEAGAWSVRVGVVQTNIPADNKTRWAIPQRLRDFGRFLDLTRSLAAERPPPDLIVWPETMFPGNALNAEAVAVERAEQKVIEIDPGDGSGPIAFPMTFFIDRLLQEQEQLNVPMLIGTLAEEGLRYEAGQGRELLRRTDAIYNSAVLVREGRVDETRYDKIALTPFGEFMPVISRFERLEQFLLSLGAPTVGALDLDAGEEPTALSLAIKPETPTGEPRTLRLATPICFEVTRSHTCRSLVYGEGGARKADLIVNLSNDGWFGRSVGGRLQHLTIARWRCVELGVPMVRAVNTGISALIAPDGKVVRSGPVDADKDAMVDGVLDLVVSLPPEAGGTLFGRGGAAFGWVVLVVGLALWPLAPLLARLPGARAKA